MHVAEKGIVKFRKQLTISPMQGVSIIVFVIPICSQPRVTDSSSLFLCRAKEMGLKLPGYHFVNTCIQILSHGDNDYNKVKLCEHAVAHSGLVNTAKM